MVVAKFITSKDHTLRHEFVRTFGNSPTPKRLDNHSHPYSANSRANFNDKLAVFAFKTHRELYHFQISKGQQDRKETGYRSYYWIKDLDIKPQYSEPKPEQIISVVDVDYYVDMNYLLTTYVNTYVLYTLVPSQACYQGEDSSFHFNSKGEVVLNVKGSAEYNHPLWNYNHDTLLAWKSFDLGFFKIEIPYVAYKVERLQISPHRQAIILVPICVLHGFLSKIGGDDIVRLNPIVHGKAPEGSCQHDSDFVKIASYTDGLQVSVAEVDTHVCFTAPITVFESLEKRYLMNAKFTNISTIESVTKKVRDPSSVVMSHYMSQTVGRYIPKPIVCSGPTAKTYQPVNHIVSDDPKPSLNAFMNPLCDGGVCPTRSPASMAQAIKGRLENIANNKPFHKAMIPHINAFIKEYFPEKLHPCSIEEVARRQDKPAQTRIVQKYLDGNMNTYIDFSSFSKAEAYQTINDPRIVTKAPRDFKIEYSSFMYPIADYIKYKGYEWYAFSKTPKEIAVLLSTLLCGADFAVNADYSRYDGRIGEALRVFENALLNHLYGEEACELHLRQCGTVVRDSYGEPYFNATARFSGSPETSVFNTIDGAFILFVANRIKHPDSVEVKGIVGGDDAVYFNIPPDDVSKTVDWFGMKIEHDVVHRGEYGITFLSRYYTNEVWYNNPNSICDLYRVMSKFHMTPFNDLSNEDKLYSKSYAYFLSDKNTPIIGDFVKKVLSIDGDAKFDKRLQSYMSRVEEDEQYPNKPRVDMQNLAAWYSEMKGISFRPDYKEIIAAYQSYTDVFETVELIEPLPMDKIPAVVDGEFSNVEVIPDQISALTGATYAEIPKENNVKKRIAAGAAKVKLNQKFEKNKNKTKTKTKNQKQQPRKTHTQAHTNKPFSKVKPKTD